MLHLLIEYGKKKGLCAEPGLAPKTVKWAIECNTTGRFLGVHLLGNPEDRINPGQMFDRCPDLSQPELVGGSEERSHFLADSAQVVALYMKADENAAAVTRYRGKHAFFLKLLRQASMVEPDLGAAAHLLEDEAALKEIQRELKEKKAKPTDRVTIRVSDSYPLESDKWHSWWREFRQGLSEKAERAPKKKAVAQPGRMLCFATGELVNPALTHLKILGLRDVGGLPTGDALVCFDKEAFTSYGLEQSANGAVSETAVSGYRETLNALIRENGQRLAGAKVVHWFKEKVSESDDPLPWLMGAESLDQEERNAQAWARALLHSLREGNRPELARNRFYAATLSGAAGRVMLRDWMEGSFEQLVRNVERWFEDLSIVHREGGRLAGAPKFMAVLGATVRELDELAAPFVALMWRAGVRGEAFPFQALPMVLNRARLNFVLGNPPNHARMGMLKACLVRSRKGGIDMGPYLNEDHPSPAYQCGRVMSILADLQYEALGDVGAGVVQRYYAAASSTPALVLGRLIRNAQFHLGKTRYPTLFQDRLGSIWSRIENQVPVTLALEEQTLFALGYYQQMAHDRAERRARSAERKSAEKAKRKEE